MANHTATLRLPLDDAQTAAAVAGAVGPELDDGPPGTQARLELAAAEMTLHAEADSLSGLRALLNNAIRLLDAARRSI